MKRRLIRIGTWAVAIILVLGVIHGLASLILGHRYAAAIERVRAGGDPVLPSALAGAPVPDGDNAAVVYEEVFERLKSSQSQKQLEVLLCVPTKDGVDRMWNPQAQAAPPGGVGRGILGSPTFWTDAEKASAYFEDLRPMIEKATERPDCQFPVRWSDGFSATLPHYRGLRKVERLLASQAILQARDGKHDGALRTLALAFRVADTTCHDPILVAVLVRCATVRNLNDALLDVLKHKPATAEEASTWSALLSRTDYGPEFVDAMRKGERILGIWGINHVIHGGLGDILRGIDYKGGIPNRSESSAIGFFGRPVIYADGIVCLDYFRKQVVVSRQPYRTLAQVRLDREVKRLPRYAFLTRTWMPPYSNVRASVDEVRARTALTQILLAAQQYKGKTGSYPMSLSELQAKTGWKLPEDPFSGRDLMYTRTGKGFTVYSIGKNLKDDGGTPVQDSPAQLHSGVPLEPARIEGDIVLHWE